MGRKWILVSPVGTILRKYTLFEEAMSAAIYVHVELKKIGYSGKDTKCRVQRERKSR